MSDLPHDRAAEHACLAAIFARGTDALTEVSDVIRDSAAFFVPAHRALYDAMLEAAEAGEPINAQTVASELRRLNAFEFVGGMPAIERLREGVITRTRMHAELVYRDYRRRKIYVALRQAAEEAIRETDPSIAIAAGRKALDAMEADEASLLVPIKQAVEETRHELETRKEGRGATVAMGFEVVDEALGHMEPGDLIVLGAESGTGKTALGLSVARNCVLTRNAGRGRYLPSPTFVPVLVISGEMRLPKLVMRWLSDMTGIDGRDLRRPGLDMNLVNADLDVLGAVEITMTRPSQVRDLDLVCAAARSWRAAMRRRHGSGVPGLVLVDYLQLMDPSRTLMHRNVRSDELEGGKAKTLKSLAIELGVPVIGLSQITVPKGAEGERPKPGWLYGSRVIRHAADRITLLHRPWIHEPNLDELEREFQCLRRLRNDAIAGRDVTYDRARFDQLLHDRCYAEVGLGKTRDGSAHLWLPLEFTPELTRFLDQPARSSGRRYGDR
jgi:replicative DNA helicase